MPESILNTTKKALGIDPGYDAFDTDIVMHINSVFSILHQIGVGPSAGFMINGSDETWEQFTGGSPIVNSVKTYMYMKVRLMFDPPATSFAITAMQDQAKEIEWRLLIAADPHVTVVEGGLDE